VGLIARADMQGRAGATSHLITAATSKLWPAPSRRRGRIFLVASEP